MQDADGTVPFFWGTDAEGHLVLSDDTAIVKKGCSKSYSPFPKGKLTSLQMFFGLIKTLLGLLCDCGAVIR